MPSTSSKYILLAIKGEHVEPRLLSFASRLCRRMDAGLDIMLTCDTKSLPPSLDNFVQELQQDGVRCRLTQESDLSTRNIVQYANAHGSISTVVIDAVSNWVTPENDENTNPWHKLECPLVVAVSN